MRRLALILLVAGCSSGPVTPDWRLNSISALNSFQQAYLRGDSRVADIEFERARTELRSTGKPELLARAELVRCAVRAASLELDGCPGFESLRQDASAEELAYADYLSGKSEKAASEDPLSKLVAAGVRMKTSNATPNDIASAIAVASAQGWRRPLLAWLGVEEKRAEAAGDKGALERIRRRIELVSGKR